MIDIVTNLLGSLAFLVFKLNEFFRAVMNHPVGFILLLQFAITCIFYPIEVFVIIRKVVMTPFFNLFEKFRMIYMDEFPLSKEEESS